MNTERIEQIRARLTKAFAPTQLNILDDSHKHIGHVGSQHGAGHYTIQIAAPSFLNQKLLECHRLIYEALDDMLPTEIHALQIKIVS